MRNIIIKRILEPDNLCRSLFDYRLRVTSCGMVTAYDNKTPEDSFSHLYRLNFLVRGTATCFVNNKTYDIPNKTALYLPPNHEISIDPVKNIEEPAILFFINFEIGNLARRNEFHQLMMQSLPTLMVEDVHSNLMPLFESIFNEASDNHTGACGFIQNLFHMIITTMIRDSGNNQSVCVSRITNSTSSLINQATEYMYNHVQDNIKINELAKELGISEIYLYKLFKEHTQKSPQQFLADYRLTMAKEFLVNPDYSIKMIADELGFCCANHFSSVFKKKMGVSPNEWRKENQALS